MDDSTVSRSHTASPSYRWCIVLAGIIGLLASLGLGRFALGMMLPALGESLHLSYTQMGLIGTVNFCGYLGAVLLCGFFTGRLGSRLTIALALGLVGCSMLGIGLSGSYLLILVLYFLTGVGSALSNVPIMALVGSWFSADSRGRALGLCVMGNGLGILLSGKMVPLMNTSVYGWRLSWIALGALVVVIAGCCFLLFRPPPAQLHGAGDRNGRGANGRLRSVGMTVYYYCGAIYFLFGFTYVIYVTFFVTALVADRGLGEYAAGALWAWVGVISLGSGPLFGALSDRVGRKAALMTVFTIQAAAYLLMAAHLPLWAVYLSLGCFGLVAWSVPTIMAALIGDYAGPEKSAAMFGLVTFLFGIGQIGGPALAGGLAEKSGSFSSSFYLAGGLALLAVAMSYFLPRRPGHCLITNGSKRR